MTCPKMESVARSPSCFTPFTADATVGTNFRSGYFSNPGVEESVKIWVQLQKVMFSYRSVEGICRLEGALNTPLGFDPRTLENLEALTTSNDAIVCVEMSVLSSRPFSLLASQDLRNESLARVPILYLSNFEAFEVCHQISHDTLDCAHLGVVWNS